MTAALLALLLGCATPPPPAGLPLGDIEVFAREAQPALSAGCANPACHGSPDRPLMLYAVQRHRLDPATTFLDEPLTDEELWSNQVSAAWFVLGAEAVDDAELLRKPLDPIAGGTGHAGGVQYRDAGHPDYQALAAWVATVLGEAP